MLLHTPLRALSGHFDERYKTAGRASPLRSKVRLRLAPVSA